MVAAPVGPVVVSLVYGFYIMIAAYVIEINIQGD